MQSLEGDYRNSRLMQRTRDTAEFHAVSEVLKGGEPPLLSKGLTHSFRHHIVDSTDFEMVHEERADTMQ